MRKWLTGIIFITTAVLCGATPKAFAKGHSDPRPPKPISWVDTSMQGSEKYLLRVDGEPFFMTNIQIRMDKLRYAWNFDTKAREAVVDRAARDGFNTVSIPIQWYEVEPQKDKFDWAILDEYLDLVQRHGLKMEMLWFGQNSGGHVQWLGLGDHPVHLRVPDYVMWSPGPDSSDTKSDYKIRRDMSAYTLDLADNSLRQREMFVLSKVMEHVADWDRRHGSHHTLIGVQLDNEVRGIKIQFPASLVVSYMSDLSSVVKRSPYIVWTRLNCVYTEAESRVEANTALRRSGNAHIDFVGIDLYRQKADKMRNPLQRTEDNFPMIMEAGAESPDIATFQLAALSGSAAMDYYDMLGPDDHGLYDRDGDSGFKPHGAYIQKVRIVNQLLNSDLVDLALKAQGKSLYVHNWNGQSIQSTTDTSGIAFIPSSSDSQGISIRRDEKEFILMTTLGGTFKLPNGVSIESASVGHFDSGNVWVKEGEQTDNGNAVSLAPGSTVRLLLNSAPPQQSAVEAEPSEASPNAAQSGAPIKVVLVGDSTVAPGGGWGTSFCKKLQSNVTCLDEAMNGRSTKSFIDEGLWDKAVNEHAQFYLIQFGHNDQKDAPALHTDAASTFKDNLRRFIKEVEANGGLPILVTSLSRRNYKDGYLVFDGLEQYAAATRGVAAEQKVPVIDLYFDSRVFLNALTQNEADHLDATFHPDAKAEGANGRTPDRTHLNAAGKEIFGSMVAQDAYRTIPQLRPYLITTGR